MVTEFVEVVVRERGSRRVSRGISGIGSSARTAAVAVSGLLAALGAIAAVRGFTSLISSSVRVSAEFEQLEIRLRSLLGSQEEANRALENFVELSTRTPFSVRQIVEGASTLAAAALGNREQLEELTRTAANLAAVTGLSFNQSAENLQRALSAGIGAADLFRERGVRALIESIEGIPDATELSAEETEAAFLRVFGPDGTFGTAAADLANTLGGSLSNVGDAFTNLQDAIGDAFAPVVIRAAREAIIPFLNVLETRVRENDTEIRQFAAGALVALVRALVRAAEAGIELIRIFARAGQAVRGVQVAILQVRRTLVTAPAAALEQLLGIEGTQTQDNLAAIDSALSLLEAEGGQAEQELARLEGTLDSLQQGLGEVSGALDDVDFSNLQDAAAATDVDLPIGGTEGGPDAADREAALERIAALTDRIRIATLQRTEPLNAQLERLRQQREELEEQARITGDQTAAAEGLALLDRQIADVEQRKTDLTREQAEEQQRILDLASQIGQFSPQLAEDLLRALENALATGEGLEDVVTQLRRIREGATEQLQREQETAATLGDNIQREAVRGLSDALTSTARGAGVDWARTIGDLASRFLSDALEDVLNDFVSKLRSAASEGGGGGGTFGSAIGAAIGVGGLLAASALQGGDASVQRATVESAVTDSRQLRGVVAGPTNIPIFQVGDAIEDAFVGTNSLLEQLLGLTRQEVQALRGILTAVQGGLDLGSELSTGSPTIG